MLITIGVDEVGRGCLAGPVVAGAYFFHNENDFPPGIKDSKKLSHLKRQELLAPLSASGVCGLGEVEPAYIDEVNIKNATFEAMHRALLNLKIDINERFKFRVVFDGNLLPEFAASMGWGEAVCLVKADDTVKSVSAASIVAKEYRDELMSNVHLEFPNYNFKKNSGYGSPEHMKAIEVHGYCEVHRKSFEPIKSLVTKENSLMVKCESPRMR